MPWEAHDTRDVLQEAQDTRDMPREVQDTHDVLREAQRMRHAALRWPSTCTYVACLRACPCWCHASVTLASRRLAPPPEGTPAPARDWLGSPSWLKKGWGGGITPLRARPFHLFSHVRRRNWGGTADPEMKPQESHQKHVSPNFHALSKTRCSLGMLSSY